MTKLSSKVALVTGGSSGIGRATAVAFAKTGARVAIADMDTIGGDETVKIINEAGGEATFIKADLSIPAEVSSMVSKCIDIYSRLDYAFNNAGLVSGGIDTANLTEEEWDRTIGVNLKGVWLCMKYEIPQMLVNGGGAIVNTSSVAGIVSLPGASAYVASKHGVIGLTKTAALEYAGKNIRVNAVCPGFIETPMIRGSLSNPEIKAKMISMEPIGRLGTPEEIAQSVIWLCSDAASFVTGHSMVLDGGASIQ